MTELQKYSDFWSSLEWECCLDIISSENTDKYNSMFCTPVLITWHMLLSSLCILGSIKIVLGKTIVSPLWTKNIYLSLLLEVMRCLFFLSQWSKWALKPQYYLIIACWQEWRPFQHSSYVYFKTSWKSIFCN